MGVQVAHTCASASLHTKELPVKSQNMKYLRDREVERRGRAFLDRIVMTETEGKRPAPKFVCSLTPSQWSQAYITNTFQIHTHTQNAQPNTPRHLNQHKNGQTAVYSAVNCFPLFLAICCPLPMCVHLCCFQRACRTTHLPSVAEPNSCTGGCGGGTWRWGVRLTSLTRIRICPDLLLITLFLPQMKLIIALVVFALLLIIISECFMQI